MKILDWVYLRQSWIVNLLLISGITLSFENITLAQIVPDNTLGTERSIVSPINPQLDRIDGGATRGANLFHSFSEFNINNGRAVEFSNSTGIQNIFSRVTGQNPSNLLGTLRVLGDANLFFLNPNGIIFGENAQLDLRGSFVGSTASSLLFSNGTQFSAKNPQVPSLLIVDVPIPIGLQFEGIPGAIQVQGSNLQTQQGKTLALLGGNVNLEGAYLLSPGGRVELGGIAEVGTVSIENYSSNLRFSFLDSAIKADVILTAQSKVDVLAGGGGDITINARNFKLLEESELIAGINGNMGSQGAKAGDITINASNSIFMKPEIESSETIKAPGKITNIVFPNTTGDGGNIFLNSYTLELGNSAQINVSTSGKGDAGNIAINARNNIFLSGGKLINGVSQEAEGNGGDIKIITDSLQLINGGEINASTSGQGNAGEINIRAIGTFLDGINNRIVNTTSKEANGETKGINIDANIVSVKNGAEINASTSGIGNAGKININASNTLLDGDNSKIVSSVSNGATGDSKGIEINTAELSVKNGAEINASTSGIGNAGKININASNTLLDGDNSKIVSSVSNIATGDSKGIEINTAELSVKNGAEINASTSGAGNSGSAIINARDYVVLEGRGKNPEKKSGIFTSVSNNAQGNSGEILINTNRLETKNGAQINASISGKGNSNNIIINARNLVSLVGEEEIPQRQDDLTGIYASVSENAVGNSGDIKIITDILEVKNGAQINASMSGTGNSGSIIINAEKEAFFDGGSAFIGVRERGKIIEVSNEKKDRRIEISTGSLYLSNGAQLSASTLGEGNSGRVAINAQDTISIDGVGRGNKSTESSGIFSAVESQAQGNGGNVDITAYSISLRNGAQIRASTAGTGNPGTVFLEAENQVFFDGVGSNGQPSGVVSLVEPTGKPIIGQQAVRGDIQINARLLSVTNGAEVNVSSLTFQPGFAGNIGITSPFLRLDRGVIKSQTISGDGGDIALKVQNLLLMRHGSQISTTAGLAPSGGNGGNITIDVSKGFIVAVPYENNDITANAYTGSGGRVIIVPEPLPEGIFGIKKRTTGTDFTSDITATSQLGIDGIVEVPEPDVDPSQGLTQLPDTPRTVTVSDGCQITAGQEEAVQFFDIGRGGTPPSPDNLFSFNTSVIEWTPLFTQTNNSISFEPNDISNNPNRDTKRTIFESKVIETNELPKTITRMTPFCQKGILK
ncbi:filamentous hemagglutinin N-terminal domain-containing protein [Calothrix sp. FACHB-156]|nr:filamentous hemagglutinin N-terminal domain-containing protein [Calothrix sp. FACHB-156]